MTPIFDPESIRALRADGLISGRRHPNLPLTAYNYTGKAQHLPGVEWSEQLQWCRGLVVDDDGQIVGVPFKKFWNYEQVRDLIPAKEAFTVWEKVDGSLGIVCRYRDRLVVSTRGSFDSSQALWAYEWLRARDFVPEQGLTFLFEIVYPQNRIVVDYGGRAELVLLAVVDQAGDRDDAFAAAQFPKAQRYDGLREFHKIDQMPEFAGQEGFVVRWESGFRAKLKLTEYRRLHRLLTQCSNRDIWELLRAGKDLSELSAGVPDDFRDWSNQQISKLRDAHRELTGKARREFAGIVYQSRKEFADIARKSPNSSLLFALLDGKDITDPVWKAIEPKWEPPFRMDEF
jgi:RNA ligase